MPRAKKDIFQGADEQSASSISEQEAALSTSQLRGRITTRAVADLNLGLREAVAEEFSVPRRYGDYRELLADSQVDAVYLGVPPDIRLPMVLDSLAAGKHVLAEIIQIPWASEVCSLYPCLTFK